jgi:hypothetical protein
VSHNLDTFAGVTARLAAISRDLATRQHEVEKITRAYFQAKKDFEFGIAIARLAVTDVKVTVQEKNDRAVRAVEEKGKYFSKLMELEGKLEATKAGFKVLDRESSNLQSLLQQQRQEAKLGEFGG